MRNFFGSKRTREEEEARLTQIEAGIADYRRQLDDKGALETRDDAEKFAKLLTEEAELSINIQGSYTASQKKAILDAADKQGKQTIGATEQKKTASRKADEAIDAEIEKLAQAAKAKGTDALVPRLYGTINFVAKVASIGVSHAFLHPIDAAQAASAGLDLSKQLENELKVKSLKNIDINRVLQSNTVKNLLSDPGLWQVLALQGNKIPRILAKFREGIVKEIQDIIETPSAVSTESKLLVTKEILNNTAAVEALVQIVQQNKGNLTLLVTSSKAAKLLFDQFAENKVHIERILPRLLGIVEAIPQNRESILNIITIIEPVILRNEALDIKALIPHIVALIDNGITARLGQVLVDSQEDILAIVSNKTLEPTFKKFGLDQEKFVVTARALLPVVAKILLNGELGQLVAKLPTLVETPLNVKALLELLPNIQGLLFGQDAALASLAAALDAQKDNMASLAAGAITINPDIQAILKKIFKTQEAVKVPETLIAGALGVVTNILGQAEQLKAIVTEISAIKRTEDGNPILSNEKIGKIAIQLLPLLLNDKVTKNIESLLTPENLGFLGAIPEITPYITLANQAIIIDTSKRLLGGSKTLNNFVRDHSSIIGKVLMGTDNLANGVFEDTDLTTKEAVIMAKTALQIMHDVTPAELLTKHKATLTSLIIPALPLNKEASKELSTFAIEAGGILLSQANLAKMQDLIGYCDIILDDNTTVKEKQEVALSIADFVIGQVKSEEFKTCKDQLIGFVGKHKIEIGQLISTKLEKFNIKSHALLSVLSDEKSVDKLLDAYVEFRSGNYLKVLTTTASLVIGSKDVRSILIGVAADVTRKISYPNFLRRWLVGSRINKLINKNTTNEPRTNLANVFDEASKGNTGIFCYTLRSRLLKGLNFSTIEFKNMDIENFIFAQAKFGSSELTNFSGSQFKEVEFKDAILRGQMIDLTNTTFDMASFRSIQPLLAKAKAAGKTINTEGMKITISKPKELEELRKMDIDKLGDGPIALQNPQNKLRTQRLEESKAKPNEPGLQV